MGLPKEMTNNPPPSLGEHWEEIIEYVSQTAGEERSRKLPVKNIKTEAAPTRTVTHKKEAPKVRPVRGKNRVSGDTFQAKMLAYKLPPSELFEILQGKISPEWLAATKVLVVLQESYDHASVGGKLKHLQILRVIAEEGAGFSKGMACPVWKRNWAKYVKAARHLIECEGHLKDKVLQVKMMEKAIEFSDHLHELIGPPTAEREEQEVSRKEDAHARG